MGYLINADEYYAFQPNDINDESISIFERSVPIDYKREKLQLELPKKSVTDEEISINKSIQSLQSNTDLQVEKLEGAKEKDNIEDTFQNILKDMKKNLNLIDIHKNKYLVIQNHLEIKNDYLARIHNLNEKEKKELAKIKKELVTTTHMNTNERDEKGLQSLGLKTGENNWYILLEEPILF